eukprot:1388822-Amorphochlora_amoeboformis.AAC.1
MLSDASNDTFRHDAILYHSGTLSAVLYFPAFLSVDPPAPRQSLLTTETRNLAWRLSNPIDSARQENFSSCGHECRLERCWRG